MAEAIPHRSCVSSMRSGHARRIVPIVAVFAAVSAASIAPAFADAIDGDWCRADRRMHIEGPRMVTPGGAAITGDYTRHAFRYHIPSGEPGAPGDRFLRLRSETRLDAFPADNLGAEPEIWERCLPIS